MADTSTVNYGWTKPDIGASDDTWGGKINVDLDGIDSVVKGIEVRGMTPGPPGATGPTGATGPAGANGATGPAGPSAVSTDAGNSARLGGDSLIYVPTPVIPPGTVIGDTVPVSPQVGALWWDSLGGQLYLWYNDGNSSQWVPTTNSQGPPGIQGPPGPTGPAGPNTMPPGVTDGSDAAAGQVGEIISSILQGGSAVSLTNNTIATVTSIALTPGDWDVSGELWFSGSPGSGSATVGAWGGIGPFSLALPGPTSIGLNTARAGAPGTATVTNANLITLTMACRVSLSAGATYYLTGQLNFSSGNGFGFGKLWARRMR